MGRIARIFPPSVQWPRRPIVRSSLAHVYVFLASLPPSASYTDSLLLKRGCEEMHRRVSTLALAYVSIISSIGTQITSTAADTQRCVEKWLLF